jgi:hypothetical protein
MFDPSKMGGLDPSMFDPSKMGGLDEPNVE